MGIDEIIQRRANIALDGKEKEKYGPCPFCQAGEDRFRVWTSEGRYWCRVCGKSGDRIQFLRDYAGMSYQEACDCLGEMPSITTSYSAPRPLIARPVSAPAATWMETAHSFVCTCQDALWSAEGAKALAWLHERGLTDETIHRSGLGYNDVERYESRQSWGLPPEMRSDGQTKQLWLPRGVVIPWMIDNELWGVRIRRPSGDPKYYFIPGGQANGLYGADGIEPGMPALIFEGEINALSAMQAGYTAVATGSTHGARRPRWEARLATASVVLVAYDNDDPGEIASEHWINALPNAKRWRPLWDDVNQMLQDGANIKMWIAAGLGQPSAEGYSNSDTANHTEDIALVGESLPAPLASPDLAWPDIDVASIYPPPSSSGRPIKPALPRELWSDGLPTFAAAWQIRCEMFARYATSVGADAAGFFVRCPGWQEAMQ